jgi:hypothetical protein
MATDIVQGLFGLTPEAYQAEQNRQAQAEALRFAQLDPFQQANYGLYMGGRQLGGVVGQALGAQDPTLQRISQTQSLLRSIDPSDPRSLAAGIQAASQFNPQLALSLSDSLQKLQKNQADIFKSQRETLSTEQKNAAALADASGAERGSETWSKEYSTALKGLTTKKPGEATLKAQAIVDARTAVRNTQEGTPERAQAEDMLRALQMDKYDVIETGVAGNPELAQKVFIDKFNPTAAPIPVGSPYSRVTAKVSATAVQKGEEEFTKRLGGKDADRVDAAITAREGAFAQLDIADRIEAMSPTAFSGQFANTRAGMVNFLDTLGLTSSTDKQRLLSSQVLTADSSRLLLATLNNKLGGGISNEDAKRVEKIFPTLENSPEARQELVNIIRRSANKVIKESTNLEKYARKKKSLEDYEPTIQLPGSNVRNPYSNLSDEELAARIKAAQAAQKK